MYLINRIPSTVFGGQIPNVVLFPRRPLHRLPTWVFRCTCYIHSSDLGRDKLDNRSIWCVCLGYSRTKKVSKCCSLSICRHFVCAYVTFNESLPFFSGTLPSVDLPEAESEFVFLVTAPFIPLVKLLQVYFCPSQVSSALQVLATTPPTSEVPAFGLPIALGTGQGGNPAQSPYGGQMPDPKMDLEKQTNKEHRLSAHEQDMEIGYEDKPSTPSFEGLEQRFLDEIMKLAKEQSDAEDAENARHREKIIEIDVQYQEKLSSLRAQQAKRRKEFLLKEAQARIHQYKQAASNHFPANASPIDPRGYGMKNASPIDPRGYGSANASSIDPHGPVDPLGYGPNNARPIDPRGYGSINASPIDPCGYGPTNAVPMDPHGYGGAAATEAHRAYATGQFESSRERSPFVGGGRNQVPEARVPIPEGRVYNNTSSRNH